MAKKMDYTDDTGFVYKDTVWLPLFEATDMAGPTLAGRVVFHGYKDLDQAASKLKQIFGVPGGKHVQASWQKAYTLTEQEVRQLALAPAGAGTTLDAISVDEYTIAASRLDTDPDSGSARTPKAGDGAVSFFHDATDVDVLT